MPNRHLRKPSNLPVVAMVCGTALLVVTLIVVSLVGNEKQLAQVIGLVLTTVPSLGALWYAERASRDIRNGTVTEKARQGTVAALEETGVTEVVEASQRGMSTTVALQALQALLEERGRNGKTKPDTQGE